MELGETSVEEEKSLLKSLVALGTTEYVIPILVELVASGTSMIVEDCTFPHFCTSGPEFEHSFDGKLALRKAKSAESSFKGIPVN